MGRLVGEHFRRDGAPKKSFRTLEEARLFIQRMKFKGYPYQCGFCGEWHIASHK